MQICVFEDTYFEKFEPLVYSRPAYELVCGATTLKEKIIRSYNGIPYSLQARDYLENFIKSKFPNTPVNQIDDNDCLFLNGRILADENLAKKIPIQDKTNKVYMNGNAIVAARVSGKKLDLIKQNLKNVFSQTLFDDLQIESTDVQLMNYVWDLINNNHDHLTKDIAYLKNILLQTVANPISGTIYPGVHFIEENNITIAPTAVVKPGVVLDASLGPIFIDDNAVIFPNAVIEGPVYVGKGSQVKTFARLYDGVTVGKICKVGGEIEKSIIHSYSNKQHAGFLGHSYIGSWVNIGADTNCSDLKNNYGTVKVYVNGEQLETGCQFLGLMMADHSKAAINTMFNTGTVVGFSCNIFGAGFPPKYIPSFSWGGNDGVTTYDIERGIETAQRVLRRRSKNMSEGEIEQFRKVFEITQKERRKRGYPY